MRVRSPTSWVWGARWCRARPACCRRSGSSCRSAGASWWRASSWRAMTFDGERIQAEVLRGLTDAVHGPAVCELPEATLVVPPGWSGTTDDDGTIVLERD